MKDSQLISRIQQGEKDLLDLLIEKYYDEIFRFCYYKTGEEALAYDCAQETFLRMLRYMDSYIEKGNFKAYIFQIGRNVCVDAIQKRGLLPTEEQMDSLSEIADARDDFRRAEAADTVRRALAVLPELQREAVVLRYYHDLKIREIAAVVGAGVPTVKSRLKQGKEKMKAFLREEEGK